MEYKRHKSSKKRRRRRYGKSRQRHTSPSAFPRVLLFLLITGGIVYMLSASFLGTYLAENFIAPVFEAFKKDGSDAEDESALPVSLSSDKNSVTGEISLPSMTLYALQMGIYASPDNAEKQAEILKNRGAAGYIFNDDDKYRVLSAGYFSQDDAKTVKERLVKDGTDCALFTISCDSLVFKISTDGSKLDALTEAFSAFFEAQNRLSDSILSFDSSTDKSIEATQNECKEILNSFEKSMAIITKSDSIPPALNSMLDCHASYCNELNSLCTENYSERSSFSSAMKYAQLYLADEYLKFAGTLSSAL